MSNWRRRFFYVLGWISVVLGVIGIFLPIMPTAPFAIVAAFCFQKSSERLHSWIIRQPYFGPAIVDWDKHRVIRPQAKFWATLFICAGLVYPLAFKEFPFYLKLTVVVVAVSVLVFILSRRNCPPTLEGQQERKSRENEI